MKNFTYRSLDEKENLEAILRRRKRKLNRQQVVSGIILATIIGLVLLYCGRQILYTEYDGYIHLDVNRVRAPYNIYLDSVYVSPGKIIAKGDTLFSYYIMDCSSTMPTPMPSRKSMPAAVTWCCSTLPPTSRPVCWM